MSASSKGDHALEARVAEEQQYLRRVRSGLNASATIGLLLGLAVLAALSFYFWYGHKLIAETVDPDRLTRVGQTMLDDKLPEVQSQVQQEIERQAPSWARTVSEQAIAQAPSVRGWLVDYVTQQIEHGLDQVDLLSADQFRQLIRNHRDILERDAQDLATSPELSAERFSELVDMFDKDLGVDLKDKAEVVLGALVTLNEKLEHLAPGQSLTPSDIELRDFLMMVRRLQQARSLGGKEPSIGEAATLKQTPPTADGAEAKPAESAPSEPAKPAEGAEKPKAAAPAEGTTGETAKPADADKPKEAEAK
jgi:hypothetical protein